MTAQTPAHGFGASVAGDTPADGAVFVRPSAHATWMLCQAAVAFTSHPQYDNTSSMQASRGTGVHLLNEMHIAFGTVFDSAEQTLDAWTAEMARRGEGFHDFTTPTRRIEVAQEILTAHQKWVEQFWLPVGQHLDIISTERKMQMPLGVLPNGREVWLRGTADLVTAEPKVWDWKTSSTGWQTAKLNEITQHLSYAALVEHELEIQPREAAYVVYDFKSGTWSWSEFTVSFGRPQIDRVLREFFKMGAVLDADAAMASPAKRGASWGQDGRGWWCSAKWCGAWDICDGKYLLDDGKATGVRDNSITWK